jgi:hypothetical protein
MDELAKTPFIANWKSYKGFFPRGQSRLHNQREYVEFDFADDRTLTIIEHKNNRKVQVLRSALWAVELKNHRHYLNILKGKRVYEIVCINHVDMVLTDTGNDEKIFFAKEDRWQSILENVPKE